MPHSAEQKRARRAEKAGPPCSVEGCDRMMDARGWCRMHYARWQTYGEVGQAESKLGGSKVGYAAAHTRVVALRGRPTRWWCESCDTRASHWAYDHGDREEKRCPETGMLYSVKPEHYFPLCPPCHAWFDRERTHCSYGHERTRENTRYRFGKGWKCLICERAENRKYRAKRKAAGTLPKGH